MNKYLFTDYRQSFSNFLYETSHKKFGQHFLKNNNDPTAVEINY